MDAPAWSTKTFAMGEADAATIRLLRESLDITRFKCGATARYRFSAGLGHSVAGGIDCNARVTQPVEAT
jgi:hypothetical protein